MDEKTRVHIFISGRVQGVFFRYSAKKMAQKLGLTGWVKNLADGRVEAIFEGEKDKVEEILGWAKRGPFLAKVENLEIIREKCLTTVVNEPVDDCRQRHFEIK